jgi:long-chain acyl-CoA synthetase
MRTGRKPEDQTTMNLRDPHMTVPRMIETVAVRHGRRRCLTFERRHYTYREFNRRVNQAARGFQRIGVTRGSHVGIVLPNCPEFLFTYFAVLKIGAVNVPINTFLAPEELEFILTDCQTTTIVLDQRFYIKFKSMLAGLPALKHIVVTDGDGAGDSAETIAFQTFERESGENPPSDGIAQEDVAVIHYTSGTTGSPKGAMLSHKNLLAAIDSNTAVIQVSHRDRILVFLPLFHVFTFVVCILATFSRATHIILLKSVKQFKQVRDAILRYRISVLVGIPQVFTALVNAKIPWFFRYINPIHVCVTGGAALDADTLQAFERIFRIPLLEGYGLSETTGGICVNPRSGPRKPSSVGPPIPGVQVKVVDEDDEEVGAGEVGELWVKADNVMVGYYNHPEATDAVLQDGWLRTGDMVKIDEDGYVFVVDRKKDMLIVRGMNVYPREIEDVLNTHPKVAECAIIGVPDKQRGEVPKACIVLKAGVTATEHEFRHFCHEKIAMYKNPKYFEFRDSLPKTPTGKILKKALNDQARRED